MTSHCANPECAIALRHLQDGRLFQFEIRPKLILDAAETESHGRNLSRGIARTISHFWLCGQCSSTLTLVFDAIRGVKVSPR
jgi:hypothetical protein